MLEMQAFTNAIRKMAEGNTFHAMSFEVAVDKLRNYVAKRLRDLLVVEGKFLIHLQVREQPTHTECSMQVLKEFVLLCNGSFYQSFLTEAASILSFPNQNFEHGMYSCYIY